MGQDTFSLEDYDEKVNYKYDEDKALTEEVHRCSTHDEHYSKNKFQATEFIIDGGHGEGFCIGNITQVCTTIWKEER